MWRGSLQNLFDGFDVGWLPSEEQCGEVLKDLWICLYNSTKHSDRQEHACDRMPPKSLNKPFWVESQVPWNHDSRGSSRESGPAIKH